MFPYSHELKNTINNTADKNSETTSQKQPTFPYACYLKGWWLEGELRSQGLLLSRGG